MQITLSLRTLRYAQTETFFLTNNLLIFIYMPLNVNIIVLTCSSPNGLRITSHCLNWTHFIFHVPCGHSPFLHFLFCADTTSFTPVLCPNTVQFPCYYCTQVTGMRRRQFSAIFPLTCVSRQVAGARWSSGRGRGRGRLVPAADERSAVRRSSCRDVTAVS